MDFLISIGILGIKIGLAILGLIILFYLAIIVLAVIFAIFNNFSEKEKPVNFLKESEKDIEYTKHPFGKIKTRQEFESLKKSLFIIGGVIIFIILISLFGSSNSKSDISTTSFKTTFTEADVDYDNEQLLNKVGKLMVLPNEIPEIATVTDITMLNNQSIFNKAQNGDKVLVYKLSNKVIVYRPSTNSIIEVGIYKDSASNSTTKIDNSYEKAKNNFMKICTIGKSSQSVCDCSWNYLQSNYSAKQITEILEGDFNLYIEVMKKAILPCR